jgi:hypothetical protein
MNGPINGRWRTWVLVGLGAAVVVAAIYLPTLRRRVKTTAKIAQPSEEQARRELTQPTRQNPSDPVVKARMFWISGEDESSLAPLTVQLALSSDPVLRSKQVLNTLLAGPVDSELRTLPAEAALLAFYLLPDGTAVADFSEALATATPSGIQSEQLAVDSIARTLEANVPQVKRIKILIHGQELDTLAGHVDLTQIFAVDTKAPQRSSISLDPPAKVTPSSGAARATAPPDGAGKKEPGR